MNNRRGLEFLVGVFIPLLMSGLLGHLLLTHLEWRAAEEVGRRAERFSQAQRFQTDPTPAFREWLDSLRHAVEAGSYAVSLADAALPPCPAHLPVQVAVFAPDGTVWAPKGMRMPQRMVVGKLWHDLLARGGPERNFSMFRTLLGRGLPDLYLLQKPEGMVQPFIQEAGKTTWFYHCRGPGLAGILAFIKGPVDDWASTLYACSQFTGQVSWAVRNPATGELRIMSGGGKDLPTDLPGQMAPWKGSRCLADRWFLRGWRTETGLEVLQILPFDRAWYSRIRMVGGAVLVGLLALGLWAGGSGVRSPLSGVGIVRRFLLLLSVAVLLPGGIFCFLWASWFQGRLASVLEQLHDQGMALHRGVDDGYLEWLRQLPQRFKRLVWSPAFLRGNPREVERIWNRLQERGWSINFILSGIDRNVLFNPIQDDFQKRFFRDLSELILQRVLGVTLPEPETEATRISRGVFNSPYFGYHKIHRYVDRLFPIEVFGRAYLTLWQVRQPDEGRPVAAAIVGQDRQSLERKYLADLLPTGVYAYLTETGGWFPRPPPFPVDRALLAEACLAQRPGWKVAGAGSRALLVSCAPSAVLPGVSFVTTSPMSAMAAAEQRLWLYFLASGLLLGGIGLSVSRFLSRALVAPLSELTHGVAALEGGELAFRLPDRGTDEIGQLARSFNEMMRERAELDVAAEVQRHILPREIPSVAGYRMAFRCLPLADVGGDYLDVQRCPDGRLLLTIADVTGHGLSAAMVTMMAKTFVSLEAQRQAGLVRLVDLLNRQICQLVRRKKLLTFAGALLDPTTHRLEWTTAGHPSPMHVDGNGILSELQIIQPPIGFGTKTVWKTETRDLGPGETILFYTDGLVETLDPHEEVLGYDRVKQFLQENRRLPADRLLEELLAFRARFAAGTPLEDDLTLLILQRVPV